MFKQTIDAVVSELSKEMCIRDSLVRELYLHERIITTEAKARSIRSDAERLITKAKKGASAADYRIHAQRQVVAYLNDKTCLLYTSRCV